MNKFKYKNKYGSTLEIRLLTDNELLAIRRFTRDDLHRTKKHYCHRLSEQLKEYCNQYDPSLDDLRNYLSTIKQNIYPVSSAFLGSGIYHAQGDNSLQ